MDVLSLLRQEDDNPRGQHGGRFVSGNNLEEAAAAEARRAEIRAQRWPIGRQEAGILHLITAKNFFQRLRVAEPRLGPNGDTIWTVCYDVYVCFVVVPLIGKSFTGYSKDDQRCI